MSAGSRRNGTSKFGPFEASRGLQDSPSGLDLTGPQHTTTNSDAREGTADSAVCDEASESAGWHRTRDLTGWSDAAGEPAGYETDAAGRPASSTQPRGARQPERYAARHAQPRRKTARKRVGVIAPVAAIAATLAAGATAYAVTGNGHPQAGRLPAAAPQGSFAGLVRTSAGKADTAASAMMVTSQAAGGQAARAATATARPAGHPTATPSTLASATAAVPSTATASATGDSGSAASGTSASPSPTASATTSPSATSTAITFSCNLAGGLLPSNVTAIVNFLISNGYSHNATAGIAGNIYQESMGDPESIGMGGGGLIGWTPLPSGFVTGNPVADLQTQLAALLTYNQGWASYLPALNAAATPADAAYIYVTDFERAGIPAASTREAAAQDVAAACGL